MKVNRRAPSGIGYSIISLISSGSHVLVIASWSLKFRRASLKASNFSIMVASSNVGVV